MTGKISFGLLGVCFLVTVGIIPTASADTLASFTTPPSQNSPTNSSFDQGESFTTGAGGPWSNITFNFYSDASPYAVGDLFLYDEPYTGTAAGLGTGAGYIDEATTIVSDVWDFASAVTLSADTTYYVYMSTPASIDSTCCGEPVGTLLYYDPGDPDQFIEAGGEASYLVTGSPVAASESGTLSMLFAGLLGLGLLAGMKRFRGNRLATEA